MVNLISTGEETYLAPMLGQMSVFGELESRQLETSVVGIREREGEA